MGAGLEQIFEFARSAQSGITWATIPERRAAQNIGDIDGRPLPLVDDGTPFYAACLKLVRSYLLMYYAGGRAEYDEVTPEGPDPCGADQHLIDWHRRVNSIAPTGDLPALTCALAHLSSRPHCAWRSGRGAKSGTIPVVREFRTPEHRGVGRDLVAGMSVL